MEEKNEEPILLKEEEIWDIISFARAMAGYNSSYLSPDLINARMRDTTLNASDATEVELASYMKNAKNSELQLQKFSQQLEINSMVYKRLLAYLSNMLAFDYTYTSTAQPGDYKSAKYRKDLNALEIFMDRFDYRDELRIVVKEMLRNDAYFGCFRDVGDGYVLQELPSEYCKITGRWSGGFLFSFNMYWFLQPGVDIDMYPKFFKKKYKEIWGSSDTTQRYNPSLPPEMRGSSSWIYWVDVPVEIGTCFKLTPELATRLPYFTPLFNDLILQGLMRSLQKNINMASASKIIMGEVPLLNKEAKATVKDSFAINPELLGKFMALVKSAISDAVKVASAPLQNIEGIEFSGDNAMYDSYLRTSLASSGINTNLIFSSNIKPNAIETQLSLNVDEQMMTTLYPQFNAFINYFVNKSAKTFKFKIEFEGTDFFLNRQKRYDDAMSLFDKGIILPQKISASVGMKPHQLRKMMEESKDYDFMSLLTPPLVEQSAQMLEVNPALGQMKTPTAGAKPASKKSEGAPRKKASQISDEGQDSRDAGSNIGRGGKTFEAEEE